MLFRGTYQIGDPPPKAPDTGRFDPGPEWEHSWHDADLGIECFTHTNGARMHVCTDALIELMVSGNDLRAAVLAGMADGAERFPGKRFDVQLSRTWQTNEMPVLRGVAVLVDD